MRIGKKKMVLYVWLISMSFGLLAQFSNNLDVSSKNPLLNKYKDYEAVIIEDLGKIHFLDNGNGGFDFVFKRSTRFKINTTSGLDWAEVEIPLYQNGGKSEKLVDATVSVLNEGDHVLEHYLMKELDIYEEVYRTNMILKKFAVPNAKEGSVIEVNYSYISPYRFNLRDWIFQYSIPVLYSKFEITIIPFYEYNLLKRGTKRLDSFYHTDSNLEKSFRTAKYRERTFYYVMTDVPAFEDESFITSRTDYINRIEFQLCKVTNTQGISVDIMSDWPAVNKEMLEHEDFGKYANAARKQSKNVVSLYTMGGSDKDELINKLTGHVKQNLKWNGRQSKFASKKIKKILEEKEGNSADINLYLVGMLNAAGVEAYPLLLSTRKHGKVYKDSPMHANFNYVVACIPDKSGYLLRDATDLFYPNDQLPVKCLNGLGLLVQKDIEKWIPLGKSSSQSEIYHSVVLNPRPEESTLNSVIEILSTGYDAVKHKKSIGEDPDEVEELFGNDLISEFDSINILSGTSPEDSFGVRIITDIPLEAIGNLIFIHPFAGLPETESPLTKKARSYPVDMIYPRSRIFHSDIRIPEGYKANFVPEKYSTANDLVTLKYIPEISENDVLHITAEMIFHKRVYPSKDYNRLRYFYNDMVKRFNTKIILEQESLSNP
ncbi:MAG: hypothetical protein ABFS38_05795 [Bacteroidota bacterium]